VKTSEICGRIAVRFGDTCMNHKKIYKGGWKSVYDARSGLPSTITSFEVKDQIYQRIRDNRRIMMKLHVKWAWRSTRSCV